MLRYYVNEDKNCKLYMLYITFISPTKYFSISNLLKQWETTLIFGGCHRHKGRIVYNE